MNRPPSFLRIHGNSISFSNYLSIKRQILIKVLVWCFLIFLIFRPYYPQLAPLPVRKKHFHASTCLCFTKDNKDEFTSHMTHLSKTFIHIDILTPLTHSKTISNQNQHKEYYKSKMNHQS
jgi:hypothetical protein